MKTVWKFQFEVNDDIEINMPAGAEILTVATQQEIPCLWALVNPVYAAEKRKFKLFGTGHPFNENKYKYIGTFQMNDRRHVFHLFEININ